VKLTDIGREHIKQNYKWKVRYLETNENGYTSFQMWELMEIFGGLMGLTSPNSFNLDILFDEKDLTDFNPEQE
jgi:hypothetical protein